MFGEADREKEVLESLSLAASQPTAKQSVWTLSIRPSGETKTGGKLYVVSIVDEAQRLVGFEGLQASQEVDNEASSLLSTPPFFPEVSVLYGCICRGIVFPMSRLPSHRPESIDVCCERQLLDSSEKAMQVLESLSLLLQSQLGIRMAVKSEGGDIQQQSSSSSSKQLCVACRTIQIKTSICSRCRCVRYCSRDCQAKDWASHRFLCGIMGKEIAGKESLGPSSGMSFVEVVQRNMPESKRSQIRVVDILQHFELLGSPLWDVEFLWETFGPKSVWLEASQRSEGSPLQRLPDVAQLALVKGVGFNNNPAAICGWADFAKAFGLSLEEPWPLLFSYPLTIFHALSHICQDKSLVSGESASSPFPIGRILSTGAGSCVTVHILVDALPTSRELELAHLCEILCPLFPEATLDIFFIGALASLPRWSPLQQEIDQTEAAQEKEKAAAAAAAAAADSNFEGKVASSSRSMGGTHEYKHAKTQSCVRVHLIKAPYSVSIASHFPPDVIMVFHGMGPKGLLPLPLECTSSLIELIFGPSTSTTTTSSTSSSSSSSSFSPSLSDASVSSSHPNDLESASTKQDSAFASKVARWASVWSTLTSIYNGRVPLTQSASEHKDEKGGTTAAASAPRLIWIEDGLTNAEVARRLLARQLGRLPRDVFAAQMNPFRQPLVTSRADGTASARCANGFIIGV